MHTLKVRLTGARPLLLHSDRFANPLDPLTKAHKALTGKRKKTDDDHEAIAKSEWRGALYFSDELGPYIPGVNIESALIEGGKLSKLGRQLKRSVEIMNDRCRLEYDGPRTVEGLWQRGFYDARSVKVSSARLIRYRPLFESWACECEIAFDPESVDHAAVLRSLTDAGQYCGIGDYRPRFGRFDVAQVGA
ncbi:MAG: hypothetical protein L0H63_10000 [Nitrococcus sp.]|nr:hypothetical protein [Nitrococcus sp.]